MVGPQDAEVGGGDDFSAEVTASNSDGESGGEGAQAESADDISMAESVVHLWWTEEASSEHGGELGERGGEDVVGAA